MTTHTSPLTHPKYRADIDGLRAIAVLSVVGFHASPNWILGGFVGVDIFFVISGFLISTIIFENLRDNTFSFAQFYARRIKRIFPALIVVLISCIAFGSLVLLPDEYKQLGKHTAGGAGFISNFLFLNEISYFDNVAETKPLLHLWSLGIEEQFYIIWPLLVWFAWKLKAPVLALIVGVAAVSFALNFYAVKTDPSTTFFSPHTRVWELLCGSLLAWLSINKPQKWVAAKMRLDARLAALTRRTDAAPGATVANFQAVVGLILLAFSVLVITKKIAFPGFWAVLPTLGAVLVIAAGAQAWTNRVVLSNRILVWFGLISFPLYLWHWPLLSFARILENEVPNRYIRIYAVLAAIVLAWITYKFIEKPLRFGKFFKHTTAMLVTAMVLVGGAGLGIYLKERTGNSVGDFDAINKAIGEWDYPGTMASFKQGNFDIYYRKSAKSETTLFVGDSLMEQYGPRMVELIKTAPNSTNGVIFVTNGGCLPIPGSPYVHKAHCEGLTSSALTLAADRPEITTVVIAAEWNQYLSAGGGLGGTYGQGSALYNEALANLAIYIQAFKKLNKKVVLVLNSPVGGELDPRYLVERGIKNFPKMLVLREGGVPKQSLIDRFGSIQADLRKTATSAGAIVINPLDFLCSATICPAVDVTGVPMYKDAGHLRPTYVKRSVKYLDGTVTASKP